MTSKLTFSRTLDDGVTYEWHGGFGAVLKSYERGVKIGTVRHICGRPVYAYASIGYPSKWTWWRKREIWWSLPGETDAELLRTYEREFLKNSG